MTLLTALLTKPPPGKAEHITERCSSCASNNSLPPKPPVTKPNCNIIHKLTQEIGTWHHDRLLIPHYRGFNRADQLVLGVMLVPSMPMDNRGICIRFRAEAKEFSPLQSIQNGSCVLTSFITNEFQLRLWRPWRWPRLRRWMQAVSYVIWESL